MNELISIDDMDDIFRIIKITGLLIDGISKTVKHEIKR